MTPALRVITPGLLTTIQDQGRPHAIASGVPPGGAMDRFAHSSANLLVWNDLSAATLECTMTGPRLVAERACAIAITGADLAPRVNGQEAPIWTSFVLAEGDELAFAGRRLGARAYVAVAGGIVGDRWLGSMSTNLMVGRGGMHGRALVAGDVIAAGEPLTEPPHGAALDKTRRPDYADHELHAIPGPHPRPALFGATFRVSTSSNRMGYRLEGDPLEAAGEEILSFALVPGTVQVPPDGRPILLMADHQTAGGYPVAAVVVSASMPAAAQLAPGDEVRFAEISIERALEMRAAQRAALESLTISLM
jgi:antagonist of KipI